MRIIRISLSPVSEANICLYVMNTILNFVSEENVCITCRKLWYRCEKTKPNDNTSQQPFHLLNYYIQCRKSSFQNYITCFCWISGSQSMGRAPLVGNRDMTGVVRQTGEEFASFFLFELCANWCYWFWFIINCVSSINLSEKQVELENPHLFKVGIW